MCAVGERMMSRRAIVLIILLLAYISMATASNVLFVTSPRLPSHIFGMRKMAEEIASRQHNVLLLILEQDVPMLEDSRLPTLQYRLLEVPPTHYLLAGPKSLQKDAAACDAAISNSSIMAHLQAFDADVLVGEPPHLCIQVLASKLDKVFIGFWPMGPRDRLITSIYPKSGQGAFLPNPLAYVPQADAGIVTQRMSFFQRLHNFSVFLLQHAFNIIPNIQPQRRFYNAHGVDPGAPDEARRGILYIFSADFALEWVRPLPPNVKYVGPLLPQPALPLSTELEAFLEGPEEQGALYVAMGSVLTLDLKERQAMAAAFAALPGKVLWRLSPEEVPDLAALVRLGIGRNTKVDWWMPQNEVLGHPRVKAFLSHCGSNSMYEAAYHGVPMIGLPLNADQPDNADKIVARDMGMKISRKDIFKPALVEAIQKVLQDPSYAAAAANVSRKLRARKRTPVQEAADWVEHALETGVEPYLLSTPEAELFFVARHSLYVYASMALIGYITYWAWSKIFTAAVGVGSWRFGRS